MSAVDVRRLAPDTIITSCDLVHFGHFVHGDLWRCGDVWVFNCCLNSQGEAAWQPGPPPGGSRQLVLHDSAQTFERRGVIVLHMSDACLNPDAAAYVLAAEQRRPTSTDGIFAEDVASYGRGWPDAASPPRKKLCRHYNLMPAPDLGPTWVRCQDCPREYDTNAVNKKSRKRGT